MHEFAKTLNVFRSAATGMDMMITARIESFTTRVMRMEEREEQDSRQAALDDSLRRVEVYRGAGADAVMIHSKSKASDEIRGFLQAFRSRDPVAPLVVVPTTYSSTSEECLYSWGANVVIYANHLMRAKISAVDQSLSKEVGSIAASSDERLQACAESRNFGCLARMLAAKEGLTEAQKDFLKTAKTLSYDRMGLVVERLLTIKTAGGADSEIISVEDLLKINSVQITAAEDFQRN